MFDLQKLCQGHGVNYSQDAIRWQISKSTNVIFYIFYFRYSAIGPALTKVAHAHTHAEIQRHTQRNGQGHDYRRYRRFA